ncbi:hypothetical protein HMN09_00810500 [Mycena chlorophos]|uniref:Uncharacterized protein n=1 Tax=Mycena chlorophos TaxID=658473 RepID=A0A8H6SUM5_MYCCL|nr:hypothetical protein HMN09_00810500 [Mycena chlorophos]
MSTEPSNPHSAVPPPSPPLIMETASSDVLLTRGAHDTLTAIAFSASSKALTRFAMDEVYMAVEGVAMLVGLVEAVREEMTTDLPPAERNALVRFDLVRQRVKYLLVAQDTDPGRLAHLLSQCRHVLPGADDLLFPHLIRLRVLDCTVETLAQMNLLLAPGLTYIKLRAVRGCSEYGVLSTLADKCPKLKQAHFGLGDPTDPKYQSACSDFIMASTNLEAIDMPLDCVALLHLSRLPRMRELCITHMYPDALALLNEQPDEHVYPDGIFAALKMLVVKADIQSILALLEAIRGESADSLRLEFIELDIFPTPEDDNLISELYTQFLTRNEVVEHLGVHMELAPTPHDAPPPHPATYDLRFTSHLFHLTLTPGPGHEFDDDAVHHFLRYGPLGELDLLRAPGRGPHPPLPTIQSLIEVARVGEDGLDTLSLAINVRSEDLTAFFESQESGTDLILGQLTLTIWDVGASVIEQDDIVRMATFLAQLFPLLAEIYSSEWDEEFWDPMAAASPVKDKGKGKGKARASHPGAAAERDDEFYREMSLRWKEVNNMLAMYRATEQPTGFSDDEGMGYEDFGYDMGIEPASPATLVNQGASGSGSGEGSSGASGSGARFVAKEYGFLTERRG